MAIALTDRTTLVSVMAANNEVGTIQPIAEIGEIVRGHARRCSTSTPSSSPRTLPLDVIRLQVDLVSLAAHKLDGPKGVGALFVRRGTHMLTQLHGRLPGAPATGRDRERGGHRRVRRGLQLARTTWWPARRSAARLGTASVAGLTALAGVTLTGHQTERLPNNVSVLVEGVEGGDLVAALDLEGVAASTGSACTAGRTEPSHVLLAMGIEPELAHGSMRLTAGPGDDRGRRASRPRDDRPCSAGCGPSMGERAEVASADGRTVAAMSGGVDSSVAAAMLAARHGPATR